MDGGSSSLVLQVAMGVALAACTGLRAFLPLLVVGVAGRLGLVGLGGSFQWLASSPALVVLGVAAVAEVLADKIPIVDHLLDLIGGVVKPVAGSVLATAVLTAETPLPPVVLGVLAGGGSAGLVHLTKAKLRLFSSVTTAGIGNPFLSVGEDIASLFGSVLAVVIPVVLIGVVVATLVLFFVVRRRLHARAANLGDANRR